MTTAVEQSVEQLSVNAIRTLSIDMIENANSGHPGITMGAAPMAYVLWTDFMNLNPKTQNGLIATVLSYQLVMVQHYYIAYYIYRI